MIARRTGRAGGIRNLHSTPVSSGAAAADRRRPSSPWSAVWWCPGHQCARLRRYQCLAAAPLVAATTLRNVGAPANRGGILKQPPDDLVGGAASVEDCPFFRR